MTYQGWTNYETYAVNEWFGESIDDFTYNRETPATGTQIRSHIEEQLYIGERGFKHDIIRAALSKVNWDELAEAYEIEESYLIDEL